MADGKGKSNHYSPVKQEQKQGFAAFIWNGSTKEFLGRTAGSWFKITVFYIFFFAGLAAFFGLMLYIFMLTLNPAQPKWVGKDGLIGGNPGVGFRPMPDQNKNVESTLIWINRNEEKNNSFWAKELTGFFNKFYNKTEQGENPVNCAYGGDSSNIKQACFLDISNMNKACSKENFNYGYEQGEGTPCVLVKLNKIYNWIPEPYNNSKDLEEARKRGMPGELIQNIENMIKKNSNDPVLNTIWVSCEGENPADRENIGPLQYYAPAFKNSEFQGIPAYYFPFMKQDRYKAPFVFVKFMKPQYNVLIQIECKAWAKNIVPNRQDRLGSVHFELMID